MGDWGRQSQSGVRSLEPKERTRPFGRRVLFFGSVYNRFIQTIGKRGIIPWLHLKSICWKAL